MCRAPNHPGLKEYYIRDCTLLRKVIRRAKAMFYDEIIKASTNKSKASWKIIKKKLAESRIRNFPIRN
jgi:hypothetical protein